MNLNQMLLSLSRKYYLFMYSAHRVRLLSSLCFSCVTGKVHFSPLILRRSLLQAVVFRSKNNIFDKKLLHTIKGWKALVKPKLAEEADDAEFDPEDAPCEEGTGAIPHNILLSSLNECSTVQEQINALNSILSLSEEDIANRREFCKSLAEVLSPYFLDIKVHQFGSSTNGLGFKGCDIDVCIQTTFNDEPNAEYATMDVPNLDDVLSGKVLRSDVIRLHPKLLLRYVRRIFRRHSPDIREPIMLIKARCPILRFYNEKYDLFCDLSCQNRSALRNTKLLRFICHMDSRIGSLIRVLRYWGKHLRFVGDIEMFNSYAFSLLVVYFFQNTVPEVLPPLNELLAKAEYLRHGDVGDDDLMQASLKCIPPSENKQSVEELLKEFFFFYLYYDFSEVMLPLTSYSIPKRKFESDENPPTDVFELSTVCVQDPFRHSFNATSGVAHKHCRKFLGSILQACQLYQNPTVWIPNQQVWGLSAIFSSVPADSLWEKCRENNKYQTFQVVLKPTESEVSSPEDEEAYFNAIAIHLKCIFEHALLFECTQLHVRQESRTSEEEHIIKLRCKVLHNTWVGRRLVWRMHLVADTHIDTLMKLEHKISLFLAHHKKSDQMFFKVVCDCYATKQDGQVALKFGLTVESGKMPSVVTVFLQEYVQNLLPQLL